LPGWDDLSSQAYSVPSLWAFYQDFLQWFFSGQAGLCYMACRLPMQLEGLGLKHTLRIYYMGRRHSPTTGTSYLIQTAFMTSDTSYHLLPRTLHTWVGTTSLPPYTRSNGIAAANTGDRTFSCEEPSPGANTGVGAIFYMPKRLRVLVPTVPQRSPVLFAGRFGSFNYGHFPISAPTVPYGTTFSAPVPSPFGNRWTLRSKLTYLLLVPMPPPPPSPHFPPCHTPYPRAPLPTRTCPTATFFPCPLLPSLHCTACTLPPLQTWVCIPSSKTSGGSAAEWGRTYGESCAHGCPIACNSHLWAPPSLSLLPSSSPP